MGSRGCLWVPRGFGGFPWVSLGFLGFFRFFEVPKDILGHFGYIWVLMGISRFGGFPWVSMDFLGFLSFLKFNRTF